MQSAATEENISLPAQPRRRPSTVTTTGRPAGTTRPTTSHESLLRRIHSSLIDTCTRSTCCCHDNHVSNLRTSPSAGPLQASVYSRACSLYASIRLFLPRDALLCKARSCDRMASVCLSVTLVDQDHMGWKSGKLIARTHSPIPSPLVAQRTSTYSEGT